jgi:CheY-like chemotaxis protein
MGMPQLLLVDDSQAVLDFGKAVLSSHYHCATATNGLEALEAARRLRPDGIVLDLSMPVMDGDECLAQLKGDPSMAAIPVLILSSEARRARACLKLGAEDWLPKPATAQDLRVRVGALLKAASELRRSRAYSYLGFHLGGQALAFPLMEIHSVHLLPAARRLPAGPRHLREFVELGGEAVGILDLAGLLGLEHRAPLLERRLLVGGQGEEKIAVAADSVDDPSEAPGADIQRPEQLGGCRLEDYSRVLAALIRREEGMLPVLHPLGLLEEGLLKLLPGLLRGAAHA